MAAMGDIANFDIEFINDLLRRVAKAEILPRFRHLAAGAVRVKSSPLDLVTDADVAAEVMIASELLARYPHALIVGEEAAAVDPHVLDGLASADLAFVIDPIDGTSNFAAGMGLFGVMLAVVAQGEVVAGIIYDPLADDSAIAVKGEGAWRVDALGRRTRLQVAAAAPFEEMIGTLSWRYFPIEQRPSILAAATGFGGNFDFRCAAQQYRLMASGNCHFMLYYRLMPWDHAAGYLLLREAGGYAAMLDGREYRPSILEGGYLCATDADSWHSLRRLLLGCE